MGKDWPSWMKQPTIHKRIPVKEIKNKCMYIFNAFTVRKQVNLVNETVEK